MAADQSLAGRGQHFNSDVIRDVVFFDRFAHEVEVGLRSRRKGHFDFLEAGCAQRAEQAHFALDIHRLEQGLIAVTQIGAHPIGARVMLRSGHWRSASTARGKAVYLLAGFFNMIQCSLIG